LGIAASGLAEILDILPSYVWKARCK